MSWPAAACSLLLIVAGPLAAAQPVDQHGASQPWRGSDDQYTIIDFAASWCLPCWDTLPKLEAFADANSRFKVIVVSVDDKESGRQELISGLELSLPVLWDSDYQIAEQFEPEALPATFVLAPGGEIVYRHVGSSSEDWRELIAYLTTLD